MSDHVVQGFGPPPAQAIAAAPKSKPKLDALAARTRRYIAAGYDAAATNEHNRKHWANADALSARAAHSPAVRRMLRIRSRYEVANSPLAKSILARDADFVVGTGPRLQVNTRNRGYNRAVESAFNAWTTKVKYARKLWQMRFGKSQDGESFAVFFSNLASQHPVKLDLKTIESDQVADPTFYTNDTNGSDGIIFDDFGNAAAYRILKQHPGDLYGFVPKFSSNEYDTESASNVLHYFLAERAGQVRGIPETTPALPLFAMRRRFMLAVVAAAETAANNAGVIKTPQSAVDPEECQALDEIELQRNLYTVLPKGYDLSQMKAEHPTTTFDMFDRALVREIARCKRMPYGIAAGDSSPYNFASGKLDLTPWYMTVRIEQNNLEEDIVDPTFERWYAEARLIPGYLPPSPYGRFAPPHRWFWDGVDLLDPREVGAKTESLKNGIDTFGRIWARKGFDVIDEWEAEAELLGLTFEQYREMVVMSVFGHKDPADGTPFWQKVEDEHVTSA